MWIILVATGFGLHSQRAKLFPAVFYRLGHTFLLETGILSVDLELKVVPQLTVFGRLWNPKRVQARILEVTICAVLPLTILSIFGDF